MRKITPGNLYEGIEFTCHNLPKVQPPVAQTPSDFFAELGI